MKRSAAIGARFLLFHVLSVFGTGLFLVLPSEFMAGINDSQPGIWVELGQTLVVTSVMAAVVAVLLLLPSALGWWAGTALLKTVTGQSLRLAGQGAVAGLAGFASMTGMLIWLDRMARNGQSSKLSQTLMEDLMALLPLSLGIPVGAFFGWLVYRRIWPNLPAPALR